MTIEYVRQAVYELGWGSSISRSEYDSVSKTIESKKAQLQFDLMRLYELERELDTMKIRD